MRIVRWIIGLYCLFVGLIMIIDVTMVLFGAKIKINSPIGVYYNSPIIGYNIHTGTNLLIGIMAMFALFVAFMMYYITVMNREIKAENSQIMGQLKKMNTVAKKKPSVK